MTRDDIDERARRAHARFREDHEREKRMLFERLEAPPRPAPRVAGGRLLAALAAAALVVAALFAVFAPEGGTVAWADVAQRMDAVTSVTYRLTTFAEDADRGDRTTVTEYAFRAPNRTRIVEAFTEEAWRRDPAHAPEADASLEARALSIQVHNPIGLPGVAVAGIDCAARSVRVLRLLPPPPEGARGPGEADFWASLRSLDAEKVRHAGRERLGELDADRYEAAGDAFGELDPSWRLLADFRAVIWVDPATKEPIRIEFAYRDPRGRALRSVFTDIRFDVPLADEVFMLPAIAREWPVRENWVVLAEPGGVSSAPRPLTLAASSGTLTIEPADWPRPEAGLAGRVSLGVPAKENLRRFTESHAGRTLSVRIGEGAAFEVSLLGPVEDVASSLAER